MGFPESRIEELTLWGNETGWMSNYTVDTVFSNLRIVGTTGEGIGFDASNVYNRGVHRYEGFDVSGYEIGVHVSLAGDVTEHLNRTDDLTVGVPHWRGRGCDDPLRPAT